MSYNLNESSCLSYDQMRNVEEESKNTNQIQQRSSSGAMRNQSPEDIRKLRLNLYDDTETIQIIHLDHNSTDEQGLSEGEKVRKSRQKKSEEIYVFMKFRYEPYIDKVDLFVNISLDGSLRKAVYRLKEESLKLDFPSCCEKEAYRWYYLIGLVYYRSYVDDEAFPWIYKAVQNLNSGQITKEKAHIYRASYNMLSYIYIKKGKLQKAWFCLEKGKEVTEKFISKDVSAGGWNYQNYALYYWAHGDYEKAEEFFFKESRTTLTNE